MRYILAHTGLLLQLVIIFIEDSRTIQSKLHSLAHALDGLMTL